MSHLEFCEACTEGDLGTVKYYTTDVNAKNSYGCSPLCVSCQLGHLNISQFLLTIPECDVNFKCPLTGNTPLHIASLNGHGAIVQELLNSRKCDVNCKNQAGDTPLHMASFNGHETVVQELLNSKECDINCKNLEGNTPLHMASHRGHNSIVDKLLNSKECDVNCKNKDQNGDTPLHMAVQTRSSKCVMLLLASASCDPNAVNSEGDTPLHIACQQGSVEIINLLVGSDKLDLHVTNAHGKTPLHNLFQMKCFPPVRTLLEKICSLNYVNREQIFQEAIDLAQVCEIGSLLHLACLYGSVRIVEFFLGSSYCTAAAVNKPDINGDTPLHIAARKKMVSVVEMLLACHGVDPNAKNVNGETALIAACSSDSFKYVQILVSFQGCDLNSQDSTDSTALHVAGEHDNSECVSIILSNSSCNPNISNIQGDTPLHMAVQTRSSKCVMLLLASASCDPNAVNSEGDTPLHIACQQGSVEIINLLVGSDKLDLHVTNAHGKTPLHNLFQMKCFPPVRTLLEKICSLNYVNREQIFQEAIDLAQVCEIGSLLHFACLYGSVRIVEFFLGSSYCTAAAVNKPDVNGDTPLHIAARQNMVSVVEMLLACQDVDPNAKNVDGETALIFACSSGCFECAQLLGSYQGCDLNKQDNTGNTALHIAVQHDNSEFITILLCNSSCNPNIAGLEGDTPLHVSIKNENSKCVKALLASVSCDPNAVNSEGDTPLHIACRQGSVEIINLLVGSNKIDLHVANAHGITTLHVLFQMKRFALIIILLETLKSGNPNYENREHIFQEAIDLAEACEIGSLLHLACRYGSVGLVEFFLGSSYCTIAAVNKPDVNGDTPLHIAARRKMVLIIAMLLACDGVDPNTKNVNGETALIAACNSDSFKCAQILASFQGCDLNKQDSTNSSALHIAVEHDNSELIRILLCNSSCNPNIAGSEGNTPLHLSVKIRSTKCVKALLASTSCDPNTVNNHGNPPLYIACQQGPGSVEIINLLLGSEKLDLPVTNAHGKTPLHILKSFKLIITCNLEISCSPNYENSEQIFQKACELAQECEIGSLLHLACLIGSVEIVEFLFSSSYCTAAAVNKPDVNGDTPLHIAARKKMVSVVEMLLLASTSCDPNKANSEGDTPLHIACQQGSVEIIDLLLSSEKLRSHTANVQGMTPLHIVFQNKKLLIKLLEKTCNPLYRKELQEIVDQAEKNGIDSLLHLACIYGSTAITELFLGSSYCTIKAVNEPDMDGDTPLHIATRTTCQYVDPNVLTCNSDHETSPHVACRERNLKLLLSDERCDVDKQNKTGDTALHIAIQEEQISIVKYLMQDIHCNPAITNADGNTPLHIACQQGSVEIIDVLLSSERCDIYVRNAEGKLPLHATNLETIKYFIKSKHYNLNEQDDEGNTVLHLAVQTNQSIKCILLLASTSCDPNKANSEGDTPLHIACQQGSVEIIDLLLSSEKLRSHTANVQGMTPLHIVFQNKKLLIKLLEKTCNPLYRKELQEIVDQAEKNGIGSLLHLACIYGSTAITELFLGSSYCTIKAVNEPDMDGDTPLHIATRTTCQYVDPNVLTCNSDHETPPHVACRERNLKLLLSDERCDVDKQNKTGDTALHIAIQEEQISIVKYLMQDIHCNPAITNADGNTPLHIACQQGSVEIIDVLLSSERRDIYVRNAEGKLPLHATNLETIKYFIKSKHYNLNEQDDEGNTVLHLAVQTNQSIKCILLLASTSCDPNKANSEGDTPLHIACQQGSVEIINLLVGSDKLDLHVTNAHGKTPLHNLFQMKCFPPVRTLLEKICSLNYVNREQIFQEAIDLAQVCEIGSLLHLACLYGSVRIVEFFLGSSYCTAAAVNKPDINGDTPLHIAARKKMVSVVEMLLACHGVDPNAKNVNGETALIAACSSDSFKYVQILVSFQGCDLNSQDSTDSTALHVAGEHDNSECVSIILSNSSCNPNISNIQGDTPLHMAVQTRSSKCVMLLLASASCDPNAVNSEGDTPLHIACQQGSVEIINLLVGSDKLDLHVTNAHGKTPLHNLFQMKCFPPVRTLLEKICSLNYVNREQIFQEAIDLAQVCEIGSLLHFACLYGSVRIVEFFLGSSYCTAAAVNKPDVNGDTPLHIAARQNMVSVVEMLLACQDVDPNAKNVDGETALIFACSSGCFECAQLLGSYQGCDLNKQDNTGNTALHIAVQHDNSEFITILLCNSSCNPNIAGLEGDTPLHVSIKNENSKCVKALLASVSCDPNAVNSEGDTPLHIACRQGSVEIINLLVGSNKIDLHVANAHGITTLHVLFQMKRFALIIILLETLKSGNPNYENREHIFQEAIDLAEACEIGSLLHLACRYGSVGLVEFFLGSSYCTIAAVNKPDVNGDTPLHIAARRKMVLIIAMLLACDGVDPNTKNVNGETALIAACNSDSFKCAQILASFQGCDLNKQDSTNSSALHIAVEHDNSELIRILLCNSSCNPNIAGSEGNTPLHLSVKIRSTKCVKALLASTSCDPNTVNNHGNPPLYIACQQGPGSVEIINLLLGSEKLDLPVTNAHGKTPLHILKSFKLIITCNLEISCSPNYENSEQIFQKACELAQECEIGSLLHLACLIGSVEIVEFLFSSSYCTAAAVNKPDVNGDTPLHIAARKKMVSVVEMLLLASTSCDPNKANSEGDTPLHIACQQGSVEIIDLLLSSEKLRSHTANVQGMTPLHIVFQNKKLLIKLLEKTCNPLYRKELQEIVDQAEKNGIDSLLHLACIYGSTAITELFLGSSYCTIKAVNEPDMDGDTPLHIATRTTCQYVDPNVLTCNSDHETSPHVACRERNLKLLLSDERCDVDKQNKTGDTALHIAIQEEQISIVKYLMQDIHCNPAITNADGNTPLHIACQQGSVEIIDVLLSSERRDIYVRNAEGKLPLHATNLETIKYFIKSKHYNLNEQDDEGNTVLHLAVQTNQSIKCILLLASTSCDPNKANSEGDTPLHIACQQGSVEIIDLLLSSEKLRSHTANVQGMTPLHIVFQNKKLLIKLLEKTCNPLYRKELQEIVDQAEKNGIGSLLHLACIYGSTAITELFLGSSYCTIKAVNEPDMDGDTPLHIATRTTCQYVDPNVLTCNSDHETPPHVACRERNLKLLLSDERCDVDKQNKTGDTALHIAIQEEQISIVKYLMQDIHCNPAITNADGNTPLHIACQQGSVEIIDVLLSSERCDIYVRNAEGKLPLHATNLETIKYFIKSKHYNLNEQDDEGNTVLHLAVQTNQSIKCILLLASTSCDPNKANSEGDTPLHIACQQGSVEIIDLLLSSEKLRSHTANVQGMTPLHIVFQNKKLLIKLLEKTCNPLYRKELQEIVDQAEKNGIGSLLHLACIYGSTAITELFLGSSYCTIKAVNEPDMDGDTPLHIATRTTCQYVGPNVLTCNSDHETPLACRERNLKLLLSDERCDVDKQNKTGDTALHIAIQEEQISIVKYLMQDIHCNPAITNADGNTPLHIACQQGSVEIIDVLLSSERRDIYVRNAEGKLPLHATNLETIKYFIKSKHYNLNEQDDEGNTVLHLAVQTNQSIKCILLLASTSCDPNKANSEGDTPLHIACQQGSVEIIDLLLSSEKLRSHTANVQGMTPLHIVFQNKKLLIKLLEKTCNPLYRKELQEIVDQAEKNGIGSLLHLACIYGSTAITELFLGSSYCTIKAVNEPDMDGDTPLHIATRTTCQYVGPNVLTCNSDHETPLACRERNLKLLLSDERCDVDKQNKTGDTALHIAIQEEQISIVKYLMQNIHCNPAIPNADGNTPLHLACNKGAWKAHGSILMMVKLLLSTGRVDPECVNNDGRTPVELAHGNHQIIKELSSFVDTKLKHRIQSYIKLFFMGNAYAGKSTLVQAICTEASKLRKLAPSSQYKQVTGVEPLTAGIVPLAFCSKHFGNAILYDFAGQHEYYSSHAAILENLVLSSPPVFLLVFNLSEPIDQIREELAYWWSFIDSHCKKTSVTPHVILIGSHKDVVKSRGDDVKQIMERIIKSMREIPATFHTAGHISLDCRNLVSNGLSQLLTLLKDTCNKLRESADVNIDLRCHILYAFLTDTFQHRVACTASEIQATIKTDNTTLPQNPTDLEKVLSTLSDMGHILFLRKSSQSFEDSWIVLQRQVLLTEVHGSIFAPKNFRQHIKDLAQVTGVVPLSKIKQRFQHSFNSPTPELVIVYSLAHLEFCFKIEDYHTLDIFASDSRAQEIAQENEEYYFFPALVQVETPTNVWKPNPQMTFQCGWFYECIHLYQFLTTRFLHVLILRLAFSFALAVDHTSTRECPAIRRQCSMWKHGIAWWNDDGIETIVEVGLQRHWVIAMMRCAEDQQVECVQHRTAVIKSILDTKDEFCPSILMSESLISPSSIQYPYQKESEKALYSLKDVAKTLVKGKPYVTHDIYDPIKLTELLPLEPYIGLSKEILEKLFSDEYLEKQVTDPDLIQNAEKSYHNDEVLLCVYLPQVFQDLGSKTFKELQTQLSKFSIFCGRNPLVSTLK